MSASVRKALLLVVITLAVLGISGSLERSACGQQMSAFAKSRDWSAPSFPCPEGNGGCAGVSF
jgi:hypothetical protein